MYVGIARPPAFPTPYRGGKSLRMAKIRLMTRETKRTAPPQIACGGNISSPACIPRPSNHQARSNVRTYVRMHAAYEDVPRRQRGLRANVRAYIHHKRGCNHRSAPTPPESRKHLGGSKPPARETSSKPPRFPQYYVRTFVRPSVAYARKSVRTYVRSCFSKDFLGYPTKDFLGYPTFCWDLQFNNNPD